MSSTRKYGSNSHLYGSTFFLECSVIKLKTSEAIERKQKSIKGIFFKELEVVASYLLEL